MLNLPFVTALCPTFRHPSLLACSLALWLAQDYPADRRELVILDDGGTFDSQQGHSLDSDFIAHITWTLHSRKTRASSLPAKYNELLMYARPETEIFLVWEDDDTYLPGYVSAHADALKVEHVRDAEPEFSKPEWVRSDYAWKVEDGRPMPQREKGNGRFHSSMAFTADLIRRVGGWPVTDRADFDQQFISRLRENAAEIVDPWPNGPIQYVYGWNTGSAHCQSTMRSPDDSTWYARGAAAYKEVPHVGKLVAKLDDRAKRILRALSTEPALTKTAGHQVRCKVCGIYTGEIEPFEGASQDRMCIACKQMKLKGPIDGNP